MIALDASHDSMSTQSIGSGSEAATQRKSAETAVIRHFYIDEVYRGSGIQVDLLRHAVKFAFDSDDRVIRIKAPDSPLNSYIRLCLREAGFASAYAIEEVGLFGWKVDMGTLERNGWERKLNKP